MNHKFVFTTLVASLLLIGSISANAAYNFKMFVKGLPAGTTAQTPIPPSPPVQVSLTLANTTLPEATRGVSYSYDFSQLLSVIGATPAPSSIAWSTVSSLPPGLSLGTDGILAGTPTMATSANMEIVATYTDKIGQAVYTIVVNGQPMDVTQISTGYSYACALTTSGGVKCWGNNANGQLGDGTTTNRLTPVNVSGLTSGVASISAGGMTTCALTTGSGVKCWGYNANGQLGNGATTQRLTPVDVTGLTSGVASISVGYTHACAITTSGGAKCWGHNLYGEIGDGTATHRYTPVNVTGLTSGVANISVGSYYTCVVTTSGGAKCWGAPTYGRLGDGTTNPRYTPVDVTGLTSGVSSISTGWSVTCALTTSGGVKCWGDNPYGQVGDGTTTNRLTPVNVSGLTSGVSSISSRLGGYHACAVTAGGAKCWGYNANGQVGDGTTTNRLTPVNVSGLTSGVSSVSIGANDNTCALTTSGGVKCWGHNGSGQLGDGSAANRYTPVNVNF